MRIKLCLALLGVLATTPAAANGWTLNLGYQNPAVSTYGLNFLHFWTDWAFEIGIGWVDVDSQANKDDDTDSGGEDDDSASAALSIAGDLDMKYMLAGGKFRPYVQGGVGYGIGAAAGDDAGFGAGIGGVFVGIGLLAGSPDLYVYAAYSVFSSKAGFIQAGVGFGM